jgi:hypothetical protein
VAKKSADGQQLQRGHEGQGDAFASFGYASRIGASVGALLVKLSSERVRQLIDAGHGQPFAPAGRTFREWVAITVPDRRRWQALLAEARDRAAGLPS